MTSSISISPGRYSARQVLEGNSGGSGFDTTFRENILYREAEPWTAYGNNGAAPVAVATGSQNAVITGTSAASPIGKCYFVESATIGLNQPGILQIEWGAAGYQGSAFPNNSGQQGISQIYHPGTMPITVPYSYVARALKVPVSSDFSWGLRIRNNLTGGSVNYIGSVAVTGWRITDDLDFSAPKVTMFVGDSLLNGTGPTSTAGMYSFLFKNYLSSIGTRTRIVLKSTSGSTSGNHETWRANGWHDITQCDLCVYALGVNDAGQAVSGATFSANLSAFWNWYKNRYPSGKFLVLGVPPLENNTSEAAAAVLRTAASDFVTNTNNSRLRYIDLGTAFDRTTGVAVYVASDTPGDRVHPNTTGHAAIATTIQNGWPALGWTI